jgi:hypothetical protein
MNLTFSFSFYSAISSPLAWFGVAVEDEMLISEKCFRVILFRPMAALSAWNKSAASYAIMHPCSAATIHPRYIHGLIVYSPPIITSYEMLPSCRVRSLRQRSFPKLDLVVSNMYELCFFEQSRMLFLSTPLGIFRFTMQSIQRSRVRRNPLLRA